GRGRRGEGLFGIHIEGPRLRRARSRRGRHTEPDAPYAARGAGGGRRRRLDSEAGRPARIRRPARRVPRDARAVREAGAREDNRGFYRLARRSRVQDGPTDEGAAHTARKGDVEYLHGPGAAGDNVVDVR